MKYDDREKALFPTFSLVYMSFSFFPFFNVENSFLFHRGNNRNDLVLLYYFSFFKGEPVVFNSSQKRAWHSTELKDQQYIK